MLTTRVQPVRIGPFRTELKLNAESKWNKFSEFSRQNWQKFKALKVKTRVSWIRKVIELDRLPTLVLSLELNYEILSMSLIALLSLFYGMQ